MSWNKRLMEAYFDHVYSPIYDFITAQTSPYRRLLQTCIDKLDLRDGERVLCVGVGTGNEIVRMLEKGNRVNITGVDTSRNALRRASAKARRKTGEINVCLMDAQRLGFADGSFDKVFCHHVMGFLADDRKATEQILRVLRNGGQYVITYPSGSGARALGEIRRSIVRSLRSREVGRAAVELLAVIGASLANIPVAYWARPSRGFYSRLSVQQMFADAKAIKYDIVEDIVYQDIIVHGG
ncbi:MAG: class I SAM-dependent methyltransferase, partial [Chloroflexi bacterium]|nr:class I SAM-dependent methyltransferase [Chloroflexota bacterium]